MTKFELQINEATRLHLSGRRGDAEQICRDVLQQDQRHDGILNLLALMAHSQHRLSPALKLVHMAIAAAPCVAEYHNTLGVVLGDLRRWEESFAAFAKATQLDSACFNAHRNLAVALSKATRLDEAIAPLERAARLRPDEAEPLELLISLHHQRLDLPSALCWQRKLVTLRPDDPAPHSSLLYNLHYDPEYAPHRLLDEHLEWASQHERPLLNKAGDAHPLSTHDNDPDPDRPLRLGYVSAGLREHPNARFQELILANHDRERFTVFCYVDEPNPDAVTERLRGLCDQWVDTTGLSDEALAARVREDRIDVLVDLTGHDHGNRLLVFARRPAPVQATYNGYIDTTGMSSMGYRITDALHDPPGLTDQFHTEKLVRLPICNWCYRGDEDAPSAAPPPALSNGGCITFGSLNKPVKVTPDVAALWGQVLAAVPGSRLLLMVIGGEANRSARDALVRWGIPSDRLTLVGQAPTRAEYLRRFDEIDICLDPFPFNGITTTCDALWMGVPVVTLAGRTHVSRAGVSLLSAVGLMELIAQTPEQYIQIAAALASDLPRLTKLRAGMRERFRNSPLHDGRRVARALELAYREMWRRWVSGGGGAK